MARKHLVCSLIITSLAMLCTPASADEVLIAGGRHRLKEPLPLIQLKEGDAVVFPPAFGDRLLKQCSRSTLGTGDSYWTPLESDIKRREEILAEYMKQHAPADKLTKNWPDLRRYHRQYVGVVRAGNRSVYASFLPHGGIDEEDWRQQPLQLCDGGPDFFGVEIDTTANAVMHVDFDGCLCAIAPAGQSDGRREDSR